MTPGRTPRPTTPASSGPGSGSSGRCRPATIPSCWLSRRELCGHHRDRAGGDPPCGPDPLADPAAGPVARLGPDPGQGPGPPGRAGARLARGRTRRDRSAVEHQITTILGRRWVAEVIGATLTGEVPATLRLSWPHRPGGPPAPGGP